MNQPTSAWVARFELGSADDLRNLLTFLPLPFKVPADASVEDGASSLRDTLADIFLPSPQDLDAVARILGAARAYAAKTHTDIRTHLNSIYQFAQAQGEATTTMVTSLAGGGKSRLAKACERVLAHRPTVEIDGHGSTEIVGGLVMNISTQPRQVDVLNAIADGIGGSERFSNGGADSQRRARLMLRRAGVCFLIVDEFQFITSSKDASAQLSKILGFLRTLGVPLFFVGNYSLGWKLKKRPQEERQRNLTSPIILLPDPQDAPEYVELVRAYKLACGGLLEIDPERDSNELHWLTFGIRRLLKLLVVEGFRIGMRRAKRQGEAPRITMADLKEAYQSSAFEANRQDVEELRRILAGQSSKRSDLACPFELPPQLLASRKRQLEQMREFEHSHAVLRASLTPQEAAGVQRMAKEFGFDTPLPNKPSRPPSKRPKKTADALLAGLRHGALGNDASPAP